MPDYYRAKIKIWSLPTTYLDPIDNIADRSGDTRNQFLRNQFRIIVDNYPKWMHVMPDGDQKTKDVRVENLDPEIKDKIVSIAAHLNVGVSSFLKMEMFKIQNNYPDDMKMPMPEF